MRLRRSKLRASTGGLHIDVDADVGISRPPHRKPDKEILRVLLNLHRSPRRLKYTAEMKHELREMGLDIPEERYESFEVSLPIHEKVIEIPPRDAHSVYLLKFWSSLVPHVGVTGSEGMFLAGFGAYAGRQP